MIMAAMLLSGIVTSCKKDPPPNPEPTEPVMPPLTHQGLNTFGCYIDGELFVANEGESVWSVGAVSGGFNEDTRLLNLQGTRYSGENKKEFIYIFADVLDSEGEYEFKVYEDGTSGYSGFYNERCDYYYQDIPDLGKLNITHLDEEQNIIAGTFYMNLINENCEAGDTLMKITEGRFDFRY